MEFDDDENTSLLRTGNGAKSLGDEKMCLVRYIEFPQRAAESTEACNLNSTHNIWVMMRMILRGFLKFVFEYWSIVVKIES